MFRQKISFGHTLREDGPPCTYIIQYPLIQDCRGEGYVRGGADELHAVWRGARGHVRRAHDVQREAPRVDPRAAEGGGGARRAAVLARARPQEFSAWRNRESDLNNESLFSRHQISGAREQHIQIFILLCTWFPSISFLFEATPTVIVQTKTCFKMKGTTYREEE